MACAASYLRNAAHNVGRIAFWSAANTNRRPLIKGEMVLACQGVKCFENLGISSARRLWS